MIYFCPKFKFLNKNENTTLSTNFGSCMAIRASAHSQKDAGLMSWMIGIFLNGFFIPSLENHL